MNWKQLENDSINLFIDLLLSWLWNSDLRLFEMKPATVHNTAQQLDPITSSFAKGKSLKKVKSVANMLNDQLYPVLDC